MKKTRFTEEQMVKMLREPDKSPVSEMAKKRGVSDVTIYARRKRFGELEAVDGPCALQTRSRVSKSPSTAESSFRGSTRACHRRHTATHPPGRRRSTILRRRPRSCTPGRLSSRQRHPRRI
jgi:Zn-dependent peptidase ImmA (M78 family)